MEGQQLALVPAEQVNQVPVQSSFSDSVAFEHAQRVAKMLSSSNLVPKEYQGNVQNTMIALEMANRAGASPLMVMQNLYIVHGKPSWSSSFIIAALNSCKKFSPLRFELKGEGDDQGCYAYATDLATGDKIEGPRITIGMAKKEGWITRSGSKWQSMPELMLRYRAAAFFGRLYVPELLMGFQTAEEVQDVEAPLAKMTPEEIEKKRVEVMVRDVYNKAELEKMKKTVPQQYQYIVEDQIKSLSKTA